MILITKDLNGEVGEIEDPGWRGENPSTEGDPILRNEGKLPVTEI